MRAESGGEGGGDLVNKIKIVKVDSEDNSIVLPGAVFKIKRVSDGAEFELTTDEKGEAVSDKLVAGEYTIEEVTPPAGYIKNDEIVTVSVKDGEALLRTITNEKVKINIPVEKVWKGPATDSVTVRLFADGIQKEEATLNAEGNWKHTFTDLPVYDPETGEEIVYTIEEVEIKGYTSAISGSATDGFTVTNTKDKPPVKEKSPSEPKAGILKTPKTGDSAPMVPVILLLVVSGALWIGLRRKAQKQ
jgi:LPXTG-motif cell wall-anchored protein